MAEVQITELPIDSEPAEQREEPQAPEPMGEEEQSIISEEPRAPETPAPKKRGRPAGSRNRPKAEVAPKAAKATSKAKAKSVVEELPEELPPYVQQELPPPPQQDLAAALLGLMQNHERERVGRKRAQYAGWVSRF